MDLHDISLLHCLFLDTVIFALLVGIHSVHEEHGLECPALRKEVEAQFTTS